MILLYLPPFWSKRLWSSFQRRALALCPIFFQYSSTLHCMSELFTTRPGVQAALQAVESGAADVLFRYGLASAAVFPRDETR